MLHSRFLVGAVLAIFSAVFCTQTVEGQTEESLPESTACAFCISDFGRVQETWATTGLARAIEHPGIGQYLRSLQTAMRADSELFSLWSALTDSSGAEWEFNGNAVFALVETREALEPLCIAESDDVDAVANLVKSVSEYWEREGASRSKIKIGERDWLRLQLTTSSVANRGATLLLLENQGQVVICTRSETAKLVCQPQSSLAKTPAFRSTVSKVKISDAEPVFWWFAKPGRLAPFVIRKQNGNDDSQSLNLQMFLDEGLDAVKAVGGRGAIERDSRSLIVRAKIWAKKPFRRAMRLLDLVNLPPHPQVAWQRSSVSSGSINFNIERLLDSFATLFEALVAEGEEGVFELVLEDLKTDPRGPQVDLNREILDRLQTPIYFATPSNDARGSIIGVKTNQPQALAATLEKIYAGDADAKTIENTGYAAWKIRPMQQSDVGVRQPYVIAIRDGFLMVAPSIDHLEAAFVESPPNRSNTGPVRGPVSPDHSCAQYSLDVRRFIEGIYRQLEAGKFNENGMGLLQQLGWLKILKHADASTLPEFSAIEVNFSTVLNVDVRSVDTGWELDIIMGRQR